MSETPTPKPKRRNRKRVLTEVLASAMPGKLKLPEPQLPSRKGGGESRNITAVLMDSFEERVGGKGAVLAAIRASGLSNLQRLADLADSTRCERYSLNRLVRESGVDPSSVIVAYAKGKLLLGQSEAVALAADGMPAVVRELIRLAGPIKQVCRTCVGTGKVPGKKGGAELSCPTCLGAKFLEEPSEKQEFAITQLASYAQMIPRGPGVVVNAQQNLQVNQNSQFESNSGLSESLLRLNDRLLRAPEPVSAEKVTVLDPETASDH